MANATYQHAFATWTGDGAASKAISGGDLPASKVPSAVIIKQRTAGLGSGGAFATDDMTSGDSYPIPGGAVLSDGILSLDAGGFTVGANNRVNQSAHSYVALVLYEGSGHYFRTGVYAGNGTDGRTITVQSDWQPDFGFVLGALGATTNGVLRSRQHTGDQSVVLASDTTASNLIQSFVAAGFTVGDDADINGSGHDYYYFMFRRFSDDLDDVVDTKRWTGDGGATQDVSGLAFQPGFMIHGTAVSGIASFWRHTTSSANVCSNWPSAGETAALFLRSFSASGFQAGSSLNALNDVHESVCFTATASISVGLPDTVFFRNPLVELGGVNLSPHVTSVELNYSTEALDRTAHGHSTRIRTPGLLRWTVDILFHQDFDDGAVDDTLFALLGTVTNMELRPNNACSTDSNPRFTGSALVADYSPMGGAVGSLLGARTQLVVAGALTRAVTS